MKSGDPSDRTETYGPTEPITDQLLMGLPVGTCNRLLVALVAHPAWQYDTTRRAWTKRPIAGTKTEYHAGPSFPAVLADPVFAAVLKVLEPSRP